MKFKLLIITAAGLLCAQSAWADDAVTVKTGNWVPEDWNTSETFAIYNTDSNYKKFIGHAIAPDSKDNKLEKEFPVLVSESEASFFQIDSDSKGMYFENKNIAGYYLDVNSNVYQTWHIINSNYLYPYYYTTSENARRYEYDNTNKIYNLKYRELANYSFVYLTPSETITTEGKPFLTYSKDSYKYWAFISRSQYMNRLDLERLVKKTAENTTISTERNAAIEVLNSTDATNIGTRLSNAYSLLLTASNKSENLKALTDQVDRTVAVLQKWINFGYIPSGLETAVTDAKSMLKKIEDGKVSADSTIVTTQTTALKTALDTYDSPVIFYGAYMKNSSTALGYTFPEDDETSLKNAVIARTAATTTEAKTAAEASIKSAITSSQTKFRSWVTNDRTAKGYGFPKGSDMTAMLSNNSFETNSTDGWTTTGSIEKGGTDGTYQFKGTELSQTVSLPNGNYTLTYYQDGQEVSKPITVTNGLYTINITSETAFTADGFKLTLDSGDAASFTLDETVGMPSNTIEGIYSKITVKRAIKYDTNGYWNTLCLPFDLTEAEINAYFSVVRELDKISQTSGTSDLTISFKLTASISAQLPYLVKAKKAIEEIVVEDRMLYTTSAELVDMVTQDNNTEIKDLVTIFGMIGNFVPYAQNCIPTDYGQTYVLQTNNFNPVTKDKTPGMKAFRAYFVLSLQAGASTMRLSMFESEDNSTAIHLVEEAQTTDELRDLMGRKVNGKAAGLYIYNGRKIMIK